MPQTVSKNSPSTNVLPSTSRPSATKKSATTSRSATVMPTWSKRRTCDIGPTLPPCHDREMKKSRRWGGRNPACLWVTTGRCGWIVGLIRVAASAGPLTVSIRRR